MAGLRPDPRISKLIRKTQAAARQKQQRQQSVPGLIRANAPGYRQTCPQRRYADASWMQVRATSKGNAVVGLYLRVDGAGFLDLSPAGTVSLLDAEEAVAEFGARNLIRWLEQAATTPPRAAGRRGAEMLEAFRKSGARTD